MELKVVGHLQTTYEILFWDITQLGILYCLLPARAGDDMCAEARALTTGGDILFAAKSFAAGFFVGVLTLTVGRVLFSSHPDVKAPVDEALAQGGDNVTVPVVASSAPSASREPYRATAEELVMGYDENEVAMDVKIGGRPIEVVGFVHSVEKEYDGEIIVKLHGIRHITHPAMRLSKGQERRAASLTPGDSITVLCEKMHHSMDMPIGWGCKIVQVVPRERTGASSDDEAS